MTEHHLNHAQADIFKVLGHASRLAIIKALGERPRCVFELVDLVESSQPTVSRHLDVLLSAGVVEREKQGAHMVYRLALPCLLRVVPCVNEALLERLADQEAVLKS